MCIRDRVIGILVGGETTDAVTVERDVGVEIQSPVFGIYGIELTGKFDTFVRHMAEVGPHIGKTSRGGNRHVLDVYKRQGVNPFVPIIVCSPFI